MRETSIVIAETKPLLRAGIKSIFANYHWINLLGEINQTQHLNDLLKMITPDVLIIGIDSHSGIKHEVLPALQIQHPLFSFLVILESCELHLAGQIKASGIKNIVASNSSSDELIKGLKAARSGKKYFSESITKFSQTGETYSKPAKILSNREIEVIKLMSRGLTNIEIADQLFLSKHTISTHRKNILKKLKLHNLSDVTRFAIQQKLITTS
jgi:two-component system response regulator NreC